MINSFTITDLSATEGIITLENEYALADHLNKLPHISGSFKTNMLMLFFCLKGHLQVSLSDEVKHLTAGDAFLCKPNVAILQVLASSDCNTWVLFFSPRAVDYMLPARHDIAKVLEGSFQPIVRFGEEYMHSRIFPMLDILRQHSLNRNLPFQSATMYHLFAALLFEVINHCCDERGQGNEQNSAYSSSFSTEQSSRADTLFKLFIKHLSEDNGCHRTVAYYADLLCVSPKHLSKIIRNKTGNNALSVINSHAIHLIKLDLKLTDTPINELANKYNFSNFSFFCQYVKNHLGSTPQEYREA